MIKYIEAYVNYIKDIYKIMLFFTIALHVSVQVLDKY